MRKGDPENQLNEFVFRNSSDPVRLLRSNHEIDYFFAAFLLFFITFGFTGLTYFLFLNKPCFIPFINFAQANGLSRLFTGY